jgi:hypothetical protein
MMKSSKLNVYVLKVRTRQKQLQKLELRYSSTRVVTMQRFYDVFYNVLTFELREKMKVLLYHTVF